MSKTYIRTFDLFNIKDNKKRMRYFDFCRKIALECGLICQCHLEGTNTKLFMRGSKWQFVKYYLITLLKTERKTYGIKRLVSVIFE